MEYKEILDLIARKDKMGLEALYTTYGQKFYAYAARRWFLNEDEAWEVVYQTLETLVLKLSGYTFDSKLHFDNFIFKVFTNFLRQHFRSHRKHQFDQINIGLDFSDTFEDEGDDVDVDPAKAAETDDRSLSEYYENEVLENPKLLALEKTLQQLDETERDILLLRAQNYSYDEIASMLKIENKQLKVRHHRIKQKLIQLLNYNIGGHV